ncbi:hypothetical protein [Microbacterium sp.]|uniref:hypothetical protein n=1 Tax=Microbacterium sp. TaxID=51671 RepID=UPI00391D394A
MSEDFTTINIDLSETATIRGALRFAQARYRARLLSAAHLNRAAAEAETVFDGIGLTIAERVGVRIEVSSSDREQSRRGEATASFAEVERTRTGWRLNRVARRVNRRTQTTWLTTTMPSDAVLAHAAARMLRRGTDGSGRL